MKIFTYALIFIAISLIILNTTLLDFNNLTSGDNISKLIGIVASICAICILLIFRTSKMIEEKTKNQ